mmetsp:Transcript_12391/g.24659  ORF Transcript_12391/g.24659 Transcript_12391/m.24659 type:complete len:1487 (+) Transcript_12391:138-4598(+)|eukprot:CAMPEP_0181296478 /NCGR_PEP_ID=MMETSP1101-20121128/4727_1 /TAXON_ID=46948 /ORGANISM="Rhodomonas abbreviata, Strain Caron Lab Isolate" /LENGTH=1486 /DNA_ID=CAMNT_0023401349 /DNA_START=116 /DNA_END=4576 /DNA_ORIENTATION=+
MIFRRIDSGCLFLLGTLLLALNCVSAEECPEDAQRECDSRAYCTVVNITGENSYECKCQRGLYGNGLDCSSQAYAVTGTMEVASRLDDETVIRGLLQFYSNILVTGSDQKTDESTQAAETASTVVSYNRYTVRTNFETNVLFKDSAAAEAALARLTAYGNFESEATALVSADVSWSEAPVVSLWDLSITVIKPSGFEVDNVVFNPGCGEQGCWIIDVVITGGKDSAVNVLFLPRAEGVTDGLEDPVYDNDVENTFSFQNFPCKSSTGGSNQATMSNSVCCLPEFVDKYRASSLFSTWLGENPPECQGSNPENSDFLIIKGASQGMAGLEGSFDGLSGSSVENVQGSMYRVQVAEEEMRSMAGKFSGVVGVQYQVETFIGFANLVPTGTNLLDMVITQVPIVLEKSDLFTVATHGEMAGSFVLDVKLALHSVRDMFDEDDARLVYFAAISYDLTKVYSSQTVPSSSVRVGKGVPGGQVDYFQACPFDWNDAAEQTLFDMKMGQSCAPDFEMCADPQTLDGTQGVFYVPVEGSYLDVAPDVSLFIELVLEVIDSANKKSTTLISGSIPLQSPAFQQWCDNLEAHVLSEFVSEQVIVGINTLADSVQTSEGFLNGFASEENAAGSTPAEGQLTLAVEGDEEFFLEAGAAGMCLQLEDLVTVHFMETGELLYEQVLALVEEGTAIDLSIDRENNAASMTPSAALLDLCTDSPVTPTTDDLLPSPCITRVDVRQRAAQNDAEGRQTAVELPAVGESAAAAVASIEMVVGEESGVQTYVEGVTAEYGLNARYNKAWWVNPGYEWGREVSSLSYVLSRRVLVLSLFNLDKDCAANRRALTSASSSAPPVARDTPRNTPRRPRDASSTLNVKLFSQHNNERRAETLEGFPPEPLVGEEDRRGLGVLGLLSASVDPSSVVAAMIDAPPEQATAWDIVQELDLAEACEGLADNAQLRREQRQRLLDFLAEQGSPAQDVQVVTATVMLNGATCSRRASGGASEERRQEHHHPSTGRRMLQEGVPTAEFETLIVLTGTSHRTQEIQNVQKLSEMEGVVSMESLKPLELEAIPEPTPAEDDGGGGSNIAMIAGAAAGGGVVLLGAGFLIMKKKSGGQDKPDGDGLTEVMVHKNGDGRRKSQLSVSDVSADEVTPGGVPQNGDVQGMVSGLVFDKEQEQLSEEARRKKDEMQMAILGLTTTDDANSKRKRVRRHSMEVMEQLPQELRTPEVEKEVEKQVTEAIKKGDDGKIGMIGATILEKHLQNKMVTKHDMGLRRKSVLLMELTPEMRNKAAEATLTPEQKRRMSMHEAEDGRRVSTVSSIGDLQLQVSRPSSLAVNPLTPGQGPEVAAGSNLKWLTGKGSSKKLLEGLEQATNLEALRDNKMQTKHDIAKGRRHSVLLTELSQEQRDNILLGKDANTAKDNQEAADKLKASSKMSYRRKSALLEELPEGLLGEIDIGGPAAGEENTAKGSSLPFRKMRQESTKGDEGKKPNRRRSMF